MCQLLLTGISFNCQVLRANVGQRREISYNENNSLALVQNRRRPGAFNVSWAFKSKKLQVCVTFSVSGKISYTAVQGPYSVLWKNQKLKSPTLTAKVHAYNKGRCTGSAKLRKISMGQFWTGYSCSFNPSLSASPVGSVNWRLAELR
jgi:hypothetical protein